MFFSCCYPPGTWDFMFFSLWMWNCTSGSSGVLWALLLRLGLNHWLLSCSEASAFLNWVVTSFPDYAACRWSLGDFSFSDPMRPSNKSSYNHICSLSCGSLENPDKYTLIHNLESQGEERINLGLLIWVNNIRGYGERFVKGCFIDSLFPQCQSQQFIRDNLSSVF